jgi:hypothetical protein
MDTMRRSVLGSATALTAWAFLGRLARATENPSEALPASVAGVQLPMTPLARDAAALARAASPMFLYNHCLRTYIFGALLARGRAIDFDEEAIFIAACLHDIGLVEPYQSPDEPFEVDSAREAKQFLAEHHVPETKSDLICDAIAFHTSALADLRAPQVNLVGIGAGADVFGSGLKTLSPSRIDEVVAAFPRFGFKAEFRRTLIGYCTRKPGAQVGTWTDAFCRAHVPGYRFPDLEERLAGSPFKD